MRLLSVSCRRQRKAEMAMIERLTQQVADIAFSNELIHQEVVEVIEENGCKIFVGATGRFMEDWSIELLRAESVSKFGSDLHLRR